MILDFYPKLPQPIKLTLVLKPLFLALTCCFLISCTQPTINDNKKANHEPDELDELDLLDSTPDQIETALVADIASTALDHSVWQERSFKGNTVYTLQGKKDNPTIKGRANGTASMLYQQKIFNVTEMPNLSWQWKINNTYDDIDEQTKNGDDFPARFYIVVQTGSLPWQTMAINYVWASNSAVGTNWNNPFTKQAKMVVLQSGDQHVGQWRKQTRNVVKDFKLFHDVDITELSGLAVMVDGDNSNNTATAWFSNIQFDRQ